MRLRREKGLSRERLYAIIVASCPCSLWIHWAGDPEGFRKAITR